MRDHGTPDKVDDYKKKNNLTEIDCDDIFGFTWLRVQ
jgi:hypothetical protein